MTIGLIIHFFDFRNDVREMIQHLLGEGHKVVVFYKSDQEEKIKNHPIEGVVYREIKEQQRSWRNRFWEYLFLFFKQLPKSRNNYFLMELFKNNNAAKPAGFSVAKVAYWVQKMRFNFLSFDGYLNQLTPTCHTQLTDIDRFIGFTEFPCDYLAARLLKEQHPLEVYVYSWDHPCKHTRFSKRYQYMVWSEAIKDDLCTLQHIPPHQVRVVGSTQFSYIFDFLMQRTDGDTPYPFPYVYYCCAIGIPSLVPDEIAIIEQIAQKMADKQPTWKLVVRPYPVLQAWDLYEPLRSRHNIVFDDAYRGKDMAVQRDQLYKKLHKMDNAQAVLHTGSTIGIEAAFLKGASLLIDFGYTQKEGLSVYNFIHQYQNDKYITDKGATVGSLEQLEVLLSSGFSADNRNTAILGDFFLAPLTEVTAKMLRNGKN